MGSKTEQWQERDRRYVWHAMKGFDPRRLSNGSGRG